MLCRERDEGAKAAQMTCDTLVKDTCARQQRAEQKRGRDAWPPLALAYWFVFCEEINELRKETGNDMRNLNHRDHRGLVLSITILNLLFYFCYFYGFFYLFFVPHKLSYYIHAYIMIFFLNWVSIWQFSFWFCSFFFYLFFIYLSLFICLFLLRLGICQLFFIFYWLVIWQIFSILFFFFNVFM